jgi:hypothetical protein
VIQVRFIYTSPGAEFSAWKSVASAPRSFLHSALHAWWMNAGPEIGAALDMDEARDWRVQNSNCSTGRDGFLWLIKGDEGLIVQWQTGKITFDLEPATGDTVTIPVLAIEFREGGNTLWVHGQSGTVLRLKTPDGTITSKQCQSSPVSHGDAIIKGSLEICLANEEASS